MNMHICFLYNLSFIATLLRKLSQKLLQLFWFVILRIRNYYISKFLLKEYGVFDANGNFQHKFAWSLYFYPVSTDYINVDP
jgi:hypothetical protein